MLGTVYCDTGKEIILSDEEKKKLSSELKGHIAYLRGYYDGKADYEPKHGRWMADKTQRGEPYVRCSICGEVVFWGKPPYCQNCGARMEEL